MSHTLRDVSVSRYEVITPRPIAPLLAQLKGKSAGYAEAYAQLQRDPCAVHLGAYRLAGPLEPAVCGLHLRNHWRLAFAIQPPERPDGAPRVVILFAGRREPRHRATDAWTVLHDLFNVKNPPEDHDKPPCCQDGAPNLAPDVLDAYLVEVRLLTRGRRGARAGHAR